MDASLPFFHRKEMDGTKQIVGKCSVCGNPIYGPLKVPEGEQPRVIRTCFCHITPTDPPKQKSILDTMRTT